MSNPAYIIAHKRDGHALSADHIAQFIEGYVRGEIPEYQMSALAMAIYFRGMTPTETATLTRVMLESGARLTWPKGLPKVDKHSTGGVGDKVSLILAPLLACCGVQVPMISGRGLGATGGTLDKLDSIPGFRTNLSEGEIAQVLDQVGCVMTGQTAQLVPADKALYALRDVTGTVPSIPLITASIMSKKLAEGLDALVLDVKFGSGAFMKTLEDARALANSLVTVGRESGLRTTALLTDMNQPLGRLCGNALEVNETVAALQGRGPDDLMTLMFALGAELLVMTGVESNMEQATARLQQALNSGAAYEKFRAMVAAQGGDLDAPRPLAPSQMLDAPMTGYVQRMDCESLGRAIVLLGGGRWVVTDQVDFSVGLEMLVRVGDHVTAGQPLLRVFASTLDYEQVQRLLLDAITIGDAPVSPLPLIVDRITSVDRVTSVSLPRLIDAACAARDRAYAPFSNYHVGAALLTTDGEILTGCNVENISYGLTNCAERVAIGTAVAAGKRQFAAIAIATSNGGAPCGACRQVLAEFCQDLPVYLIAVDQNRAVTELSLAKLLPGRFDF